MGPSATVLDPAVTSLSPPTSLCPLGPPLRHRVTSRRDSFRGEQALGALGVSGTIRGTNPGSLQPPGPGVSPPWMSPPSQRMLPTIPSPPCSPGPAFPGAETPQKPGGPPGAARGAQLVLQRLPALPRDHSRPEIARLLGGGSAGVWEGRRQAVCSHSARLVINFSLGCH